MSRIYNIVRGITDVRSPIGEIDENGYVYDYVRGVINTRSPIGQVDENGIVYDYVRGNMSTTPPIGKVDENGIIYYGISGMLETPSYAGQVEGRLVYNYVRGTFDTRPPVGEVEGSNAAKGGAALLLLLLPRINKENAKSAHNVRASHESSGQNTGIMPAGGGCGYQMLWIIFIAVVAIGVILEEIFNMLKTSWPYIVAAIVATPFVYVIARAYQNSKKAKTMVYAAIAVAMIIVIVFFIIGIYFMDMNKTDIQSQLQTQGDSSNVYFAFLGIAIFIPVICTGVVIWMLVLIHKNRR